MSHSHFAQWWLVSLSLNIGFVIELKFIFTEYTLIQMRINIQRTSKSHEEDLFTDCFRRIGSRGTYKNIDETGVFILLFYTIFGFSLSAFFLHWTRSGSNFISHSYKNKTSHVQKIQTSAVQINIAGKSKRNNYSAIMK